MTDGQKLLRMWNEIRIPDGRNPICPNCGVEVRIDPEFTDTFCTCGELVAIKESK